MGEVGNAAHGTQARGRLELLTIATRRSRGRTVWQTVWAEAPDRLAPMPLDASGLSREHSNLDTSAGVIGAANDGRP